MSAAADTSGFVTGTNVCVLLALHLFVDEIPHFFEVDLTVTKHFDERSYQHSSCVI